MEKYFSKLTVKIISHYSIEYLCLRLHVLQDVQRGINV